MNHETELFACHCPSRATNEPSACAIDTGEPDLCPTASEMTPGKAWKNKCSHWKQASLPVEQAVKFGLHACHFDLCLSDKPKACFIDLNNPEACTLATKNQEQNANRNNCQHWTTVKFF